MEYLFVYGTLQQKCDNKYAQFLHKHAKLVEMGYFFGKLYKISYYPGAVYNGLEKSKVYGSIFSLSNATHVFSFIDEYEDYNQNNPDHKNLYLRQKIIAYGTSGKEYSTWVYLFNQPTNNYKLIKSGVFEL